MKERIGPLELLGELHDPERLAEALGPRHAEVAPDLLLGVAPLLVSDDGHGRPRKSREPRDDRGVVGELPVAVELDEVRHERCRRSRACRAGPGGGRPASSARGSGSSRSRGRPDPASRAAARSPCRCAASSGSAESSSIRRRSRRIGSSKCPSSPFTGAIVAVPARLPQVADALHQVLRIHVHGDLRPRPGGRSGIACLEGREDAPPVGRAQEDLEAPPSLEPLEGGGRGSREAHVLARAARGQGPRPISAGGRLGPLAVAGRTRGSRRARRRADRRTCAGTRAPPAAKPSTSWARGPSGSPDARDETSGRARSRAPRRGPARPATWESSWKVFSAERKSGKFRIESAESTPTAVTFGKSWPFATICVPIRQRARPDRTSSTTASTPRRRAESRSRIVHGTSGKELGEPLGNPLGAGADRLEKRAAALRAALRARHASRRSSGRRGGGRGRAPSARRCSFEQRKSWPQSRQRRNGAKPRRGWRRIACSPRAKTSRSRSTSGARRAARPSPRGAPSRAGGRRSRTSGSGRDSTRAVKSQPAPCGRLAPRGRPPSRGRRAQDERGARSPSRGCAATSRAS